MPEKRIIKKKIDIEVPLELRFGLYWSLLFAIFVFFLAYAILYYVGYVWWGNTGAWILVIIGLGPLIMVFAEDEKPSGLLVEKDKQPRLVEVVDGVAEELGLPVPDKILLTPGTGIFVTGRSEKYLCIGIASLRELTTGEFKSIIAHEFGHFYGGDTVVGDYLNRMRRTFEKSSQMGVEWGRKMPVLEFAILGVIFGLFYHIYGSFFKAITYFYSRQVERRADLVAMRVGGEANFYNGLINYAAFAVFFDKNAYPAVVKMLAEQRAFINIYETVDNAYRKGDVDEIKKKIIEEEKVSMWSTHPPLKERLERINSSGRETLKTPSTGLFNNFKELEEAMTKIITQNVHNNLVLNKLYQEAVARHGKCQYCGLQCTKLQELLEHESHCSKNPNVVNRKDGEKQTVWYRVNPPPGNEPKGTKEKPKQA